MVVANEWPVQCGNRRGNYREPARGAPRRPRGARAGEAGEQRRSVLDGSRLRSAVPWQRLEHGLAETEA